MFSRCLVFTDPVCLQFSCRCKPHSRHTIILRKVSSLFFEIFILVFSDNRNVIPVVFNQHNLYHQVYCRAIENKTFAPRKSLKSTECARVEIECLQCFRMRIQKLINPATPLSTICCCEPGFTVFPVVRIPTCLLPIKNCNNLSRTRGGDDDVSWTQITMRKNNRSVVWK